MEILSSYDKKRFEGMEENKDLLTLEYLTDLSNKHTAYIFDFFFNWNADTQEIKEEAKRKLETLNHAIALPYKIATSKAKFTRVPMTNLDIEEIPEHVINFVYWGYTVFAIDELDEDWKPIINQYEPERFVKWVSEDKLFFALTNWEWRQYMLVKTFPKTEWEKGKVYNTLYKVAVTATWAVNWEVVPLDELKSTSHLADEDIFETKRDLIYSVHDFKLWKSNYWKPQLDYVKPLLKALDFELVNIKDQLLKHLQAKLVLQGIDASKMPKDENDNILLRDAEAIFLEIWASKPEYIQNKNDLLDKAVELLDKYIQNIAMTLSVPQELVAQKWQTGTESTDSKLLRMSDFINDIEFVREKIQRVFWSMFKTCVDIKADYVEWGKETEFYCIFPPVMPKDGLTHSQELNIAVMGGFLSKRTATKQYTGFSHDDLEDELTQIEKEVVNSPENFDIL